MNQSRLKGRGEMRNEVLEGFDERDVPVRFKIAISLLNNLSEFVKREQFCDLVFEINGDKFYAHRLVLALWSPVMMNMLSTNSCKMERILLTYDQPEAFQQFISFLYTGTFDGNVTDVFSVLILASTFQISILRDLCEEHLLQRVSVTNVISMFHISVSHQLTCLEWQCADHIRQHLPEVAQYSGMRDLTAEQMNSFLGSEHVSKLEPEMKLFLLISWLTEDVSNREQFLVLLLGHIDWSTVAADFLTDISQTENFFTSHPSSLYLLLQTLHSSSIPLGPYAEQFEQLRKEYSYLLNNVVNSSVYLGVGKHSQFQPIAMTLIVNSNEARSRNCDQSEIECEISNGSEQNDSWSYNLDVNSLSKSSENDKVSNFDETSPNDPKAMNHEQNECENQQPESCKRKRLRLRSRPRSPTLYFPKKMKTSSEEIGKSNDRYSNIKMYDDKSVQNQSEDVCENSSGATDCYGRGSKKDFTAKTSEEEQLEKKKGELKAQPTRQGTDLGNMPREAENTLKKRSRGRPRKGMENPRFFCLLCDFVSTKEHLRDKHFDKAHKSNNLFRCPLCQFECKWNKTYNQHLKHIHFKGPPFTCGYQDCSFSTNKIQILMEHRSNHTDERQYICDICKMSFRSFRNLYSHHKCHNDEKNFKCPVCSKCFKHKITLEQHVVTHSDHRPYLCDLCGFSTKYQSHLISHMKRHTGDVFPCTFPSCNFSTPRRSQLKAHMRSHLGIRHHECGTCGKTFIEKSHLIRHKRIHSSEKNHRCSECEYASNRADKLREHMKKHQRPETKEKKKTKNEKKQCPVTDKGRKNKRKDKNDNVENTRHTKDKSAPNLNCTDNTTKEDHIQEQRLNKNASSTNDSGHNGEENNSEKYNSNVQYEPPGWEMNLGTATLEHGPSKSKHSKSRRKSSVKQDKDLSSMDLLAHIVLSETDIRNSSDHQLAVVGSVIRTGNFPSHELMEMILPRTDIAPSFAANQSMQQAPQQGVLLQQLSVPSHTCISNSYPRHNDHHHQQEDFTTDNTIVHAPHPLMMVPNVNSAIVPHLSHTHTSQPAQNSHDPPHSSVQQELQTSDYSHIDNFLY